MFDVRRQSINGGAKIESSKAVAHTSSILLELYRSWAGKNQQGQC